MLHCTGRGRSADVTVTETEQVAHLRRRRRRITRRVAFIGAILALLFGVPFVTLVVSGQRWPLAVVIVVTIVFAGALLAFPWLMFRGHGRGADRLAVAGDTILGVVWVLFAWSVAGNVLRVILWALGIEDPDRARVVAAGVVAVSAVLLVWGNREAMRVPRIKKVDIAIAGLGAGLDGMRVVLLTDTHYGPINRARWSRRVSEAVNALDADVVCHTGDIADGSVGQREEQAAPLGSIRARLAKTYVTGNHEYFGEAQGWLDHMESLGWAALHNRHIVVERDGARLIVAGVDDRTAKGSGRPGHGADHAAALAGADRTVPVLLLAHQPKQIDGAVQHGIDLQISGHTHGGQIWPFHFLVRTDQPVVSGLSRHGPRTQLYTSRGTGFWGPPFRVFAPSEISVLVLRAE
jgi:predicted MPP superfamily phosphohydrolase